MGVHTKPKTMNNLPTVKANEFKVKHMFLHPSLVNTSTAQ